MALIHNIVLRGLNCIVLQANNVKEPEDILDFMTFCDAWSCALHSHHNTEETVYFPLLEEQATEKGVMARNHAEHEAFLPGLLALDEFVSRVKADVKAYDGTKLIKITDEFGPLLETHLRNEIVLLENLAKDEKIDWTLMGKTMAQHSKKVADRVCVSFIPQEQRLIMILGSRGPFLDHKLGRYLRIRDTWRKVSSIPMVRAPDIPLGIHTPAQGSLEIRKLQ